MRYPILERGKAQELLDLRRANQEYDVDHYVDTRGEGSDFDDSFILLLKAQLEEIRTKYPETLASKDVEGGRFEAEASSFVHKAIPHSIGTALSDADFWRFLAVVHFPALVEWRHGTKEAPAHLNNYGIGNTKRNLLFRMWIRAELSLDESADDPYRLSRFGDKDLWESHIIAVRTGNARATVRSLLTYLYPTNLNGKCRLKTKEVRQLAKRLTRLRANVLLEIYDEKQSLDLILREAERAKAELAITDV